MKGIYLKVLFAFISLLVVSCSTRSSLEVDGLQCENLNEPLGIDNTSPHFSWVLNSKEQGAEQTAYQILVASDKKYLSEGKADLWNSGKMESDKSNGILYQGSPLSYKMRLQNHILKTRVLRIDINPRQGLIEPCTDLTIHYVILRISPGKAIIIPVLVKSCRSLA